MKRYLVLLALLASFAAAADVKPDYTSAVARLEAQVGAVTQGDQVTVVHFWAPWCSNCKHELKSGEWTKFVNDHPQVKFIFITAWNDKQGLDMLASFGLGAQPNFTSYLHPNPSRHKEDQMLSFMGLPVGWIPTTWIFRSGKLRYALNYGELHFSMLSQLVDDSTASW